MYLEREAVIATIEREIKQSSSTRYCCEDGTTICTDVGYVYDWFREYAEVLSRRPAADVAPVVHGEWKNVVHAVVDSTGYCSRCGKQAVWRTRNKPYIICPNCGAKMDGGNHEQEA